MAANASKPTEPTEPAATEPNAGEPTVELQDAPSVEVHAANHAANEKRARAKEARDRAAALRAQHVEGLRNELAFLERQPKPNKKRIAGVHEQLDAFADEPDSPDIETA